ncbi:hypothetical protein D3C75_1183810 [compost metagenome]
MTAARWANVIGDPADQRQPRLFDSLCSQQRMVNATQFDAHHQNHRQLLLLYPVGKGMLLRKRRKPASGAFDQQPVGLLFQVA